MNMSIDSGKNNYLWRMMCKRLDRKFKTSIGSIFFPLIIYMLLLNVCMHYSQAGYSTTINNHKPFMAVCTKAIWERKSTRV